MEAISLTKMRDKYMYYQYREMAIETIITHPVQPDLLVTKVQLIQFTIDNRLATCERRTVINSLVETKTKQESITNHR